MDQDKLEYLHRKINLTQRLIASLCSHGQSDSLIIMLINYSTAIFTRLSGYTIDFSVTEFSKLAVGGAEGKRVAVSLEVELERD